MVKLVQYPGVMEAPRPPDPEIFTADETLPYTTLPQNRRRAQRQPDWTWADAPIIEVFEAPETVPFSDQRMRPHRVARQPEWTWADAPVIEVFTADETPPFTTDRPRPRRTFQQPHLAWVDVPSALAEEFTADEFLPFTTDRPRLRRRLRQPESTWADAPVIEVWTADEFVQWETGRTRVRRVGRTGDITWVDVPPGAPPAFTTDQLAQFEAWVRPRRRMPHQTESALPTPPSLTGLFTDVLTLLVQPERGWRRYPARQPQVDLPLDVQDSSYLSAFVAQLEAWTTRPSRRRRVRVVDISLVDAPVLEVWTQDEFMQWETGRTRTRPHNPRMIWTWLDFNIADIVIISTSPPDDRMYTVPAQDRFYVIAAQDRFYEVPE